MFISTISSLKCQVYNNIMTHCKKGVAIHDIRKLWQDRYIACQRMLDEFSEDVIGKYQNHIKITANQSCAIRINTHDISFR